MENVSRNNPIEPLWTADEVAEFLGVHVQTIYRKARSGEIPSVLVGRQRRFRPATIRDLDVVGAGADR